MSIWTMLVIGIIIGWLLEWLFDFFFWRNRRVCADAERTLTASVGRLESDNANLQTKLGNFEVNAGRVGDLEATIAARDADLAKFRADLKGRDTEIGTLKSRVSKYKASSTQLEADLSQTKISAGKIGDLEATIAAKDADLTKFRADLKGRDTEIGTLKSRVSKFKTSSAQLEADLSQTKVSADRIGDLEATIASLQTQLSSKDIEISSLKTAKAPDDLTKLWGIGPKTKALLAAAGITTFAGMAAASPKEVDDIIEGGGSKFKLSDPAVQASWHHQAQLADEGHWEELADYRKQHSHSRTSTSLRKIWGVGEKVESLLNAKGIHTYEELLNSNEHDLEEALSASHGYYHNMSNDEIHRRWVQQARLANAGKWAQLRGYQERYRQARRHDDLKLIWGIGPKIEKVLNKNHIRTFDHLAGADSELIDTILSESGIKFRLSSEHLHDSWTQQARLAANDNWDGLQEMQDKLDWSNVQ